MNVPPESEAGRCRLELPDGQGDTGKICQCGGQGAQELHRLAQKLGSLFLAVADGWPGMLGLVVPHLQALFLAANLIPGQPSLLAFHGLDVRGPREEKSPLSSAPPPRS